MAALARQRPRVSGNPRITSQRTSESPEPIFMPVPPRRSRAPYLLLRVATITVGLAKRSFRGVLPDAIGAYGGDVL
jgi:hypothetical protein